MYEHRRQPLLPFRAFLLRVALHGGAALFIIVGSWIVGILGYHFLEAQSWITAAWQTSDKGKRAKYYRLTRTGRKQLVAEQSKWERLAAAIARVVQPAE